MNFFLCTNFFAIPPVRVDVWMLGYTPAEPFLIASEAELETSAAVVAIPPAAGLLLKLAAESMDDKEPRR